MIDQPEKDKATNSVWATRLTSASWDPRRLETIRTQKADLEKVTPVEIQRLAQKYLNAQQAFRLRVEPGANASSSPPAMKIIQKSQ